MNRNYTRIAITLVVILMLISGGYLLAQQITRTESDYDAGIAAYQRGDYRTALYDFESRAHQGDRVAQFCLAYMYNNGYGVSKPVTREALKWYKKSAEQWYLPAQNNLGVLYVRQAEAATDESGRIANIEIAEKWLKAAVEQDYAPAQFNLWIISPIRYGELLIKAAVEQNYVSAQNNLLGYVMQFHDIDTDKTFGESVIRMLRLAAKQGDVNAQNNLGTCYSMGIVVKQNHKEAFKWYNEAAKQGSVHAYHNLGHSYRRGEGVNKNLENAIEYYLHAAQQGYVDAQNDLAYTYIQMDDEKYIEMASRWLINAAQHDKPIAQTNIGQYFEIGQGKVPQDSSEAYYWYSLAVRNEANRQGLKDSESNPNLLLHTYKDRDRVAERLDPVEINKIDEQIENWNPKQWAGSGTGFYVDKHYILTNAHVVINEDTNEPWKEFRIPYRRVELKDWNRATDLALLYDKRGNTKNATISMEPVKLGEKVSVFGYPQSHRLSYEGNISSGIVSGRSAIVDHPQFGNRFQHTAPTQRGNSGGPVFDSTGDVIGVSVTAMSDFLKFTANEPSMGDSIPQYINLAQNINFAIKSNVVRDFLRNNDIAVWQTAVFVTPSLEIPITDIPLTEMAAKAKKFTVPVMCYKNKVDSPLEVVEIRIEELEQ